VAVRPAVSEHAPGNGGNVARVVAAAVVRAEQREAVEAQGGFHAKGMGQAIEPGMIVLEADVRGRERIGDAVGGALARDLALVVEAPGGKDGGGGVVERGEVAQGDGEGRRAVYITLADGGERGAVGADGRESLRPDERLVLACDGARGGVERHYADLDDLGNEAGRLLTARIAGGFEIEDEQVLHGGSPAHSIHEADGARRKGGG